MTTPVATCRRRPHLSVTPVPSLGQYRGHGGAGDGCVPAIKRPTMALGSRLAASTGLSVSGSRAGRRDPEVTLAMFGEGVEVV
jgi:hypothetical protein